MGEQTCLWSNPIIVVGGELTAGFVKDRASKKQTPSSLTSSTAGETKTSSRFKPLSLSRNRIGCALCRKRLFSQQTLEKSERLPLAEVKAGIIFLETIVPMVLTIPLWSVTTGGFTARLDGVVVVNFPCPVTWVASEVGLKSGLERAEEDEKTESSLTGLFW